jgi:aspartate kinase
LLHRYESIQIWWRIKDDEGIKTYMTFSKVGYEDVLLVVSAMGKTTNALEVIKDYFDKSAALQSSVQEIIPQSDFNGSV